ncbi:MAG: hypothetical protein ACSLE9_15080 [Burkholderiaceae bacterium]
MTPLSIAATELRLVVQRAEQRAARLPARADGEDFRTETLADLLDAIDRFDPGWGTRLMLAMYPHADAQRAHG